MEVTKISLGEFEKVLALGARTERGTFTLRSMFDLCDAGRFNSRPGHHRNFVWSMEMISGLVEAVVLNNPISEIHVRCSPAHWRRSYEIVDGQQRFAALRAFCRNENPWHKGEDVRLRGCTRLPMLNGKKFSNFPPPMQKMLLGYKLGYVATLNMGNKAAAEQFAILNQNTVRLTAQEDRNARYQGPFNNFCGELAVLPEFQKLIGRGQDQRMESTELVVRFLAFYRQGSEGYFERVSNSLKGFLNSEMQYWQGDRFTDVAARRMRSVFLNAAILADTVFGKDVFRRTPGGKGRISNALFDSLACGFADRDPAIVLPRAGQVKEALSSLRARREFDASISGATADRYKVKLRFKMWEDALDGILGCSSISIPIPKLESGADLVSDAGHLENLRQFLAAVPRKHRVCSQCGDLITDVEVANALFRARSGKPNGITEVGLYHGTVACAPDITMAA